MDAPRRPKMQIIQDEVKLAHTRHWDMDMMSRAELEAYMASQGAPPALSPTPRPPAEVLRLPQGPPDAPSGQALTAWQRFLRLLSREP